MTTLNVVSFLYSASEHVTETRSISAVDPGVVGLQIKKNVSVICTVLVVTVIIHVFVWSSCYITLLSNSLYSNVQIMHSNVQITSTNIQRYCTVQKQIFNRFGETVATEQHDNF